MPDHPTFYLAAQNNFGNRGCEALVRSTVTILQAAFGDVRVLVPSFDQVRDQAQWPESSRLGVEFVAAPPMPRLIGKWGGACQKVPWLQALPRPRLAIPSSVLSDLRRADAVLSIGGDNFSLDYGLASLYFYTGISEAALALGKPTLLWGASVGPFTRQPLAERRVAEHLRRLSLITVRESRSVDYLRGIGVTANVVPVVDSAFALQAQSVETSSWWPSEPGDGVLGLNVGWLIDHLRRRTGSAEGVLPEAVGFVRDVLDRTGLSVVLVPHVAPLDGSSYNNDELFNAQFLRSLGGTTSRLTQVPGGMNASQLKYVISRCRMLIAGRTHATIAGFSSAVPTLSIAYSVKAKGINRDLFGHERYVLETPKLSREALWEGLDLLLREEAAVHDHYRTNLPLWRERAHAGAFKLGGILKSRMAA